MYTRWAMGLGFRVYRVQGLGFKGLGFRGLGVWDFWDFGTTMDRGLLIGDCMHAAYWRNVTVSPTGRRMHK